MKSLCKIRVTISNDTSAKRAVGTIRTMYCLNHKLLKLYNPKKPKRTKIIYILPFTKFTCFNSMLNHIVLLGKPIITSIIYQLITNIYAKLFHQGNTHVPIVLSALITLLTYICNEVNYQHYNHIFRSNVIGFLLLYYPSKNSL